MREIEFRGQRIDNGEWVYGFLYKLPLPNGVACMILTTDNNHEDNSIEPKYHLAFTLWVDLFLIKPETVGQFTGLTDKNGVEIYEGDIVRHPYIDPIFRDLVNIDDGVTSEVVFHDGAFVIKYDEDDFIYIDGFTRHGNVEVVGNIHEK